MVMSTGAILGAAAIGGGSQLGGGLLGSAVSKHESRNNRREARRQFNVQINEAIQRRVADGLKAGINPLTALGYSGAASPTIHAGGTSGAGEILSDAIGGAGNAVSKALMTAFEDKAADDMEYDSKSKELDLEGKRLQNDILRKQLNPQLNPPGKSDNPGLTLNGEVLVFRPAYDMEGRPRLVINQDVLEGDSDNPGYLSTIGSLYANGHIDHITGKLDREAAEKVRWLYHESTGRDLWNWEEAYISPSEAAAAAAMFARGVS